MRPRTEGFEVFCKVKDVFEPIAGEMGYQCRETDGNEIRQIHDDL